MSLRLGRILEKSHGRGFELAQCAVFKHRRIGQILHQQLWHCDCPLQAHDDPFGGDPCAVLFGQAACASGAANILSAVRSSSDVMVMVATPKAHRAEPINGKGCLSFLCCGGHAAGWESRAWVV